MSENVFWVYNGWGILLTALGPIWLLIDGELRERGVLLLRPISGIVYLGSFLLLFFVSGWIPALLYIPIFIVGVAVISIIKHRGLG